jgi:CDP-glucose 4,6-dehydratase
MEVISPQFWESKKVLVTGHTGFKGTWLCLWLRQLGAEVTGYALPPENDDALFVTTNLQLELAESVFGDIRDFQGLKHHIANTAPEVVFHLAAQPIVRRSYHDPLETFSTNVMGTANLLQACRQTESIKAVVVVTTDKCYQNQEWYWGYRETDHLGGSDPYSSSKACAELVTSAFRKSFFPQSADQARNTGIATARAGNVIGGGDWAADRLIPDCFRAIEKGTHIRIRNPASTRPWQHVLEPIRAYLMLAEQLVANSAHYSEAFNFGPRDQDVVSVERIVEKIMVRLPGKLKCEIDDQENPPESILLKLDISKAESRLRWKPILNIDQALDLTVDWYAGYADGKCARELTDTQIANYHELIKLRTH